MAFKWLSGKSYQAIAAHSTIRNLSIAETSTHRELGFMTALPSDIIPEIFSYLDQESSLECMAVCRYWYDAVPQYVENLWYSLRLHSRDAYMDHQRRERCVGKHVKEVVLEPPRSSFQMDEQEVYILFQKVIEWGCISIRKLELFSCITTNQKLFVELIQRLAPCLTHVKMLNHLCEVDILHIIYNLPHLTHLTYQYNYGVKYNLTTYYSLPAIPNDYYSNLTYLWLDVDLVKEQKEYLLSRCPNLRCFIDINREIEETASFIDLDLLFTWCPKITFLETSLYSQHQDRARDPDEYINDLLGLRCYSTSANYGIDRISRLIFRNQSALESLSIFKGRSSDDWSEVFRSLRLPKLRTLVSVLNHVTADSLVSMLNYCGNLEELKLDCPHPHLTFDSTIIQSFHAMHHVRYLQWGGINLDDNLSLLTILERFPSLQELFIYRSSISLSPPSHFGGLRQLKSLAMHRILWKYGGDGNNVSSVAQIFSSLTKCSKLESIQLVEVPLIQSRSLIAIAQIPTLKYLDIQLDRCLSNDNMLAFIIGLQQTVIEVLTFRCVRRFPFMILEALTNLPHLAVFCTRALPEALYDITFLDKGGLEKMLSKSPSLTAVLFLGSTVVKNGEHALTQSQINVFINQQTSQYNISRSKSEKWNMRMDDHSDDTVLRRLIIHCADKNQFSLVSSDSIFRGTSMLAFV